MKRRRVQPKRRTGKKPSRKRVSKPPVSFSEMILNWVIIILVVVILGFLASVAWRFFFAKKEAVPVVQAPVQQAEILRDPPRIEVLNGCGVSGVARKFTGYLRSKGFDVVKTENYRSFNVDSSFVLDRRSLKKLYGDRVAKALGIPLSRVQPLLSDDLDLEATLVLGKDYKKLKGYDASK